jgi:glutamyl/glutaminyl-tRNA synthetase
VSVDEFRRQGFLPEVLLNFLALCGWSYDGQQERFTVSELTEKFSFERVGRNPAYFDTDKLRSMNGDRIKELPPGELATRLVPYFVDAGLVATRRSPSRRRSSRRSPPAAGADAGPGRGPAAGRLRLPRRGRVGRRGRRQAPEGPRGRGARPRPPLLRGPRRVER